MTYIHGGAQAAKPLGIKRDLLHISIFGILLLCSPGGRHDLLRFYICQDLFVKDGKDPGNEESIIYNSAAVLATRKWASEDNVQPLATSLYLRDKLSGLSAFLVNVCLLAATSSLFAPSTCIL